MLLLSFLSCFHTYGEYQEMRAALLDQDGDGYIWDQFPEEGGDDCNDFDPEIHPGKAEVVYNGIDEDCDEDTPDDDLDSDGHGIETDCDDENANISPSATEVVYNGVDDDCDIFTPDDDIDGDGVSGDDDCDDTDASRSPDWEEIPYNGIDDDCDSMTPDDDLDGDGFDASVDCNDNNDSIYPGATDIIGDGIDQDCEDGDETSDQQHNGTLSGYVYDPYNILEDGEEFEIRLYDADLFMGTDDTESGWISGTVVTWTKGGIEYVFGNNKDILGKDESSVSVQSFAVQPNNGRVYNYDFIGESEIIEWKRGQSITGLNIYIYAE
jgi:hypothetical protein